MAPLLMPTVEDLEKERAELLVSSSYDEETLLERGERFKLASEDARIFRRIVEIDYLLGK